MKIIDIAIVKDNNDPLGFGRVRFSEFNELTGEKERAFSSYEKWGPKDRFVAKPLLPTNINMIPITGQSIMVLVFNTEKDTSNQFYIPGPFTTLHDFKGQRYQQQVTHTTFGMSNDYGENIFHPSSTGNDNYVEPRAEGAIAKKGDYGIYGTYGSDVIFTENGVNIRGGKLLSKEFANEEDRARLIHQPLMAEKSATLHLKKFPHPLGYVEQESTQISGATGPIKYVVEYSVDSFDTYPTNVKFFIYNVENAKDTFRVERTNVGDIAVTWDCILLNPDNVLYKNQANTTGATLTYSVESYVEAYVTIRNTINQLHNYGLDNLDSTYADNEMHPFYFRPTFECLNRVLTAPQAAVRSNIFQNVNPYQKIQKGLIYSWAAVNLPLSTKTKKENVLAKSDKNQEQTFAALKSDKIYFLSTDTNEYEKIVDFTKIDRYEPTQVNYIQDIEPNTYAVVRGEVLVDILKSMMDLFESHQHNLTDPLVKEDPNFMRLQRQINTLENDLLNNSIRIN
jgi:hypothetical protein